MIRPTRPWAHADVGASVALRLPSGRHRCPVCDGLIPSGEGVPTRYEGMTLVLRGRECRARFEKDPERYLRDAADDAVNHLCDETESPASEWCCDL